MQMGRENDDDDVNGDDDVEDDDLLNLIIRYNLKEICFNRSLAKIFGFIDNF